MRSDFFLTNQPKYCCFSNILAECNNRCHSSGMPDQQAGSRDAPGEERLDPDQPQAVGFDLSGNLVHWSGEGR